jgi:hypothetical protein
MTPTSQKHILIYEDGERRITANEDGWSLETRGWDRMGTPYWGHHCCLLRDANEQGETPWYREYLPPDKVRIVNEIVIRDLFTAIEEMAKRTL